jgi:hypothetical protein
MFLSIPIQGIFFEKKFGFTFSALQLRNDVQKQTFKHELLAKRFAPCKPLMHNSPHAYKLFMLLLPHSSVFYSAATIMRAGETGDHLF